MKRLVLFLLLPLAALGQATPPRIQIQTSGRAAGGISAINGQTGPIITINGLNGITVTEPSANVITISGGGTGGGMTWPTGTAGIPNYNGSSAWGTSYNATNPIPLNFITPFNTRNLTDFSQQAPTAGQVPIWNATLNQYVPGVISTGPGGGGGTNFTAAGDLSGTATSQTVVGIRGSAVPVPSTAGFLEWTGSAWAYGAGGTFTPTSPFVIANGPNSFTITVPATAGTSPTMSSTTGSIQFANLVVNNLVGTGVRHLITDATGAVARSTLISEDSPATTVGILGTGGLIANATITAGTAMYAPAVAGVAQYLVCPTNPCTVAPTVAPLGRVAGSVPLASTHLGDFSQTAATTTGQVPVWNATNHRYEPGTPPAGALTTPFAAGQFMLGNGAGNAPVATPTPTAGVSQIPCMTSTGPGISPAVGLTNQLVITGTGPNTCPAVVNIAATNVSLGIGANNSPIDTFIRGNGDTSANARNGAFVIRQGDQTGIGLQNGPLAIHGPMMVRAGNNGLPLSTPPSGNAGTQAGSLALYAGAGLGGPGAAANGMLQIGEVFYGTTTNSTLWHLQCQAGADQAVQNCGATPAYILGVAQNITTNTVLVIFDGEVPVSCSGAGCTLGHTVCAGAAAGMVTDSGGTGPCTTGFLVGVVNRTTGTYALADNTNVGGASNTNLSVTLDANTAAIILISRK